MSSIALETNSVQIDSTEETNGKQEPNVDQVSNEFQMEEFHIVSEATNGEQSESRQSGAEPPTEETASAEQDFCKTGPSERSNKYKYRTFEGYAGERYLQEVVKDILPTALARTWAAAVSYQAPGNVCYVGVSRLAQRERIGERKVQKDLQALRRRGLLKTSSSWMAIKQADGSWSQRAIVAKDFGRLYDLAYEYHLWKNALEYIPAEWEYADLIRENEELYKKLIRFDNYRRILCCEKPGPKEELNELEEYYHQYEQDHRQEEYEPEIQDPNKYLPKQLIKRSPYEETKTSQDSITYKNTDSSLHLEGRALESVAPATIRNDQQTDQAEVDMQEQATYKNEEEPNRQEKAQDNKQSWNEHKDERNQKEEEIPAETAKDVTEYTIEDIVNNPLAILTFLQQFHTTEQAKAQKQERIRQAKAQRHQQARQAKRKQHKTPERLVQVITEMMQTLGGNPQYLQSDLTRATKIYWACTQLMPGFSNGWFLDQLTAAFIETANGKNIRKRVPYFFSTLERNLGLRNDELAYIRSKEVLYCDTDHEAFIMSLEQLYESSGSQLDYQEWVKQTYL